MTEWNKQLVEDFGNFHSFCFNFQGLWFSPCLLPFNSKQAVWCSKRIVQKNLFRLQYILCFFLFDLYSAFCYLQCKFCVFTCLVKNTYKPCKAKNTIHIWRVYMQNSATQTICLGILPNEAFDFSIFDKSGKNKASDLAVSLCPCGQVLGRAQVQVLQNSGSWNVMSRFTNLSALYSHWWNPRKEKS